MLKTHSDVAEEDEEEDDEEEEDEEEEPRIANELVHKRCVLLLVAKLTLNMPATY